MMEPVEARLLVDCRNELAEGIQWNAETERLYWTDILGRTLWSCDENGGGLTTTPFQKRIGCFAFTGDGRLLIAFEDGLARFDPETGVVDWLLDVETAIPSTRMNDGRCDREGRFVFGGVDEEGLRPLSAVYRYDGRSLEQLFDGVGCANSIAFSPDGERMYFADTAGKQIDAIDYNNSDEAMRRPFATLSETEGRPDGSCVDRAGNLWNAQFNGACVQQFDPSGNRGARVTVPVSQVTCVCFGGTNLDRLFITTAREHFTEEQATAEPTAGGIFVASVDAKGLPEQRFLGAR